MSTLKADTIQSTSGGAATLTKQHAAKAWVNFNGTGTIATRDSFNISTLTDDGSGDYITTVTSAFSNNDYTIVGNCSPNYGVAYSANLQTMHRDNSFEQDNSTTTQQFQTVNIAGTVFDSTYITHNLHGDLA
jgi:hypothetical protein